MASNSPSLCDFAVITALPEERDAVLCAFPPAVEINEGAVVYYRINLPLESGDSGGYAVIVMSLLRMGQVDAALAAEKIINRWNPLHILMVGIAGALHGDVKLCDVVVSSDVLYYDPGKATDEGVQYRPQGYPANALLLAQSLAFTAPARTAYAQWQTECVQRAKALKAEMPPPQLHFGTIASGSLVVASATKKAELAALHQKLYAAEMEIGGVMAAVYSHADPKRCMTISGYFRCSRRGKSQGR